ncbi:hypothetical protein FBT69_03350 [Synechococcales cyanobacterium CNB]|nr:hypothetical protein [Synechococcales cyanobacterium CNB]
MKVGRMALVDAEAMAKIHPATFKVPSKEELNRLAIGSIVKVSDGRERFWVQLTAIDEPHLVGRIDNELLGLAGHGLTLDDQIYLRRCNIYSIA